jgi:hypothetical protein
MAKCQSRMGEFLGNKHVREQRRDNFNARLVLHGGSPIRSKGGSSGVKASLNGSIVRDSNPNLDVLGQRIAG